MENQSHIDEQVKQIIKNKSPKISGIPAYSEHLEKDWQLDSLDRLEVAMHIETEFGISIDDEAVAKWKKVTDVIQTTHDTSM